MGNSSTMTLVNLRKSTLILVAVLNSFLSLGFLPDSLHKQNDEDMESESSTFDKDDDYSIKQSVENNASLFPIFRFVQILIILIAIVHF